jgi:DNA-binding NarL/FixJ family response regulator
MTDSPLSTVHQHVLVVEDLPVVRAGLVKLVSTAFTTSTVWEAGSVAQAMRMISIHRISIGLIDLGLPDGNGIDVVHALRTQQPHAIRIVSTIYDGDADVFPALAAGADGYLLKDRPAAEVVAALQMAAAGVPALSPSIARKVLLHFRTSVPQGDPLETVQSPMRPMQTTHVGDVEPVALTRRELDVLTSVGQGKRVSAVAIELGISENTVAGYLKDVYRKLHISSRAEAALEARRRGLV